MTTPNPANAEGIIRNRDFSMRTSPNPICMMFFTSVLMIMGCGRPSEPPVPMVAEISIQKTLVKSDVNDLKLGVDDWGMWRGSGADGIASGMQVPLSWSDTENVIWKVPLPGRGHSSPVIVGDRIYLETADEQAQTQSVLCLSRGDGKLVWQTKLFQGHFETAMHAENTQASSTVACDGELVYALFLNDRKIWATSLDSNGKQVWQIEIGGFSSKLGYSASPMLYKSLILIAADHEQGGFVAALDRSNGEIIWRKPRPKMASFGSPRVVNLGGKDQLVMCGCNMIASYDPWTGEQLWTTKGTAEAIVGTPVVSGDLVFASGGYPQQETIALKPDGKVAWRNKVKSYVPSLLAHSGHLYMVSDDGIARCYEAATGKQKWKQRVGGNFRVSPIASGNHVFSTDMAGKTTVFRADPDRFEVVATNQLGTEAFASPGVSRGQLFVRVADSSAGPRTEWLYCIGNVSP